MNAADILKYGQGTFLASIEGLPESKWEAPGVCGVWSVKDVVAHLASYEVVLVDVLGSLLGDGPTPALDKWRTSGFNDGEVEARRACATGEVLDELKNAHDETMKLIDKIPPEKTREPGTLPWYGTEYSLDDLIVYTYYGHKREHAAQIAVYRDSLP